MPRPELSLVIPIYNEEEVLPHLDVRLKELLAALAVDTEVVFVNDGSRDRSMELLRRMASHDLRYRVIGFSRNFGHQRAITAGMEKSRGRAVVVMDADLQDPPEVILEMVAKWREGYDVVYGRRRSRVGETWFKLTTAKLFYRVFAALIPIEVPLDAGDFRLMSRRVVTTMRGLRETHRFVRGLVAWVGFRQTAVEYDRAARAAGETKYPLKKMLAFAFDGIASFSIQPLRFATYVGLFVGTGAVLYAIASILTYAMGMTVPGWTTTVVLVSMLFSVQFFMIGVLGEYVGRIYEQVKRRPLYIISERINFGKRRAEQVTTHDIEDVATEIQPMEPLHAPPPLGPAHVTLPSHGQGFQPHTAPMPAAQAAVPPAPPSPSPPFATAPTVGFAVPPQGYGPAPATARGHAPVTPARAPAATATGTAIGFPAAPPPLATAPGQAPAAPPPLATAPGQAPAAPASPDKVVAPADVGHAPSVPPPPAAVVAAGAHAAAALTKGKTAPMAAAKARGPSAPAIPVAKPVGRTTQSAPPPKVSPSVPPKVSPSVPPSKAATQARTPFAMEKTRTGVPSKTGAKPSPPRVPVPRDESTEKLPDDGD